MRASLQIFTYSKFGVKYIFLYSNLFWNRIAFKLYGAMSKENKYPLSGTFISFDFVSLYSIFFSSTRVLQNNVSNIATFLETLIFVKDKYQKRLEYVISWENKMLKYLSSLLTENILTARCPNLYVIFYFEITLLPHSLHLETW